MESALFGLVQVERVLAPNLPRMAGSAIEMARLMARRRKNRGSGPRDPNVRGSIHPCLAVVAALAAFPAHAQAAPAAKAADAEPSVLDDITVTASKREESSRAVPAGITALGGEQLEAIGATRIEDYFALVPGLTIDKTGSAGGYQVNLRGVTTGPDNTATVGMYVDDAPVGSSTAYAGGARMIDFLANDLDRLEVLRGPQGTLYGASTLGGLIKFVTRDPEMGIGNGSVATDLSQTAHGGFSWTKRGVANIPLGDSWATRLSASHGDDGGYIDGWRRNVEDQDASTNDSFRLVTRGQLADGLTMRLSALSLETDAEGFNASDYDFVTREPVPDKYQRGNRFAEPNSDQARLGNLTFDWALPVGDLKSVTSYQDLTRDAKQDGSDIYGVLLGVPTGVFFRFDTKKWTQEIRLASSGESRLKWTAGLFYTDEDSSLAAQVTDESSPDGTYLGSGTPIYDARLPTTYEEYAGFGDLGWSFTEAFDLTVGGRYAHNSQDFRQVSNGLLDTNFPAGTDVPASSSETVFTWLVNPRYRLDRNSIAYFRVASGYRAGGPNVVTGPGSAPPTYKADTLINYELGLKSTLLDGNLVVDFDVFHIDWTDIQLAVNRNGFASRENGGKAVSNGAELATLYRAASFMTLTGSAAYTEAHLTSDATQIMATDGQGLPGVPNFAATVGADFSTQFGGSLRGLASLSVRHVGERDSYFTGSNTRPNWELDAYQTVDLRAGVESGPFSVMLSGRNLLDKDGQLSADTTYVGFQQSFGLPVTAPVGVTTVAPRTIGLTLQYRFE